MMLVGALGDGRLCLREKALEVHVAVFGEPASSGDGRGVGLGGCVGAALPQELVFGEVQDALGEQSLLHDPASPYQRSVVDVALPEMPI